MKDLKSPKSHTTKKINYLFSIKKNIELLAIYVLLASVVKTFIGKK